MTLAVIDDAKLSPVCAVCDATPTIWSNVEEWRDELGRWIGFCSTDCKRIWLKSECSE